MHRTPVLHQFRSSSPHLSLAPIISAMARLPGLHPFSCRYNLDMAVAMAVAMTLVMTLVMALPLVDTGHFSIEDVIIFAVRM